MIAAVRAGIARRAWRFAVIAGGWVAFELGDIAELWVRHLA